ncbi:MAG TPA: hypothetical protein PKD85_19410, partial [Saprospiraceae bacterium]|nr:hypothetical protein [Saprospiraceae bacterium]
MRKSYHVVLVITVIIYTVSSLGQKIMAQTPGPRPAPSLPVITPKGDTTHTLSKHFITSSNLPKAPDAKGFIQRWLVLEPVHKNIARNNIITDNFLSTNFEQDNFSNDYTFILKN